MKRVLFVVETNYQLMYASILNYYLKKKNCSTAIISLMDKKSIYYDFSNFNRSYHIKKKFITRNGLTSIIEEYFFLKKNITDIDDFDYTILLIFKDSNFLQAHLINYLKTNHKINTVLLEEGLSLYRDDEIASKSIVFKFKYIIRRMILKKLKVEIKFMREITIKILK